VLTSSRYQRADIDDPAPTVKLLDELKTARTELARFSASPERERPEPPSAGWRAKPVVVERFEGDWRSGWDATGLAFGPEASEGFPHSGRESKKLRGALRSPTFTIDKPYLAVRVAGRDAKARVILNGLQLIQNPIYGGLAQAVNHGEELRWMTFDLSMWKGQTSAYLELLDDGNGYVAIAEAWFADSQPPTEAGKLPRCN